MDAPAFITDGANSVSAAAWESYFEKLPESTYTKDRVGGSGAVCVRESKLAPGNGVFAKRKLKKGECFDWGIALPVYDYDINLTSHLFLWGDDGKGHPLAATVSGVGLFYNTLGDKSNTRCVPYYKEQRYECYALDDIEEGEELVSF